MRNKYSGVCYRCKKHVNVGDSHFERFQGGWRVQHSICAITSRSHKNSEYESK